MVQQVLLEHPAPFLDDIHQRVLEGPDIELKPPTKHPPVLHLAHSYVQGFKQVDLEWRRTQYVRMNEREKSYRMSCIRKVEGMSPAL